MQCEVGWICVTQGGGFPVNPVQTRYERDDNKYILDLANKCGRDVVGIARYVNRSQKFVRRYLIDNGIDPETLPLPVPFVLE